MDIRTSNQLTENQFAQIDNLWNMEYPIQLKGRLALMLETARYPQHFIIYDADGHVIAWAVAFKRANDIWFSIIVSEQGKGIGTFLIDKLKSIYPEFYGWVIDHGRDLKCDGTSYRSPVAFYLKKGFELLTDQRLDDEFIHAVKIKFTKA